jgi:hypothetical protein
MEDTSVHEVPPTLAVLIDALLVNNTFSAIKMRITIKSTLCNGNVLQNVRATQSMNQIEHQLDSM